MSSNLYNIQEKLDKFAEICLDSVLNRYRRYDIDAKKKRAKDRLQEINVLRRKGKKGGRYDY